MHNANDVEFFVLPNKCNDLDVVQEEALFQWVNTRTNGGLHLSYDKILAIGEQLSNFPERLQWKLSVGEGWKMERNGYVLILHNEKDTKYASSEVGQWTIVEKETPRQMTDDHVRVRLRFKLDVSTKIHVKRAGDVKAVKFHPIWRSNSMKLKDFLRGQKIPLHKRDSTPILSMDIDGESTVLAVYIETKKVESETLNEKWCIHKDYNVEEKGGECRELELHLSFG
jgi:tRNA(Ile)-lysidine synthetase-like protein